MKAGDKVRAVWDDNEELIGTYIGDERGYILIKSDGKVCACLPAHLKVLEILNESR
jgi:predicted nucleic acid-binding Zn finger protein